MNSWLGIILGFVLAPGVVWADPLQIALIGDMPYGTVENLQKMRQAIATQNIDLTVHVGDIKSGGSLCSDDVYQAVLTEFQSWAGPLVYSLGDNEWTDCHRKAAGRYDPFERLKVIRTLFTSSQTSFGKNPIALDRQSTRKEFALYSENFQFTLKGLHVIGLHIVGSNNNYGDDTAGSQEFMDRERASLAWLHQGFATASAVNAKAVLIVIHANPEFEKKAPGRGFRSFIAALKKIMDREKRPVLLVHGDTHSFQIDMPLRLAKEISYPNFTRLEVFGSPLEDRYVQLRVDLEQKIPWSFTPVAI